MKFQGFSRRFRYWLVWSGVFAGLTFVVKQNYGILAFLALTGVLLFAPVSHVRRKIRWTWIGMVTVSFLIAVFLTVVLPVVLTHCEKDYWEYAYARKIGYIRFSQIPYLTEIGPLFHWMKPSFFSYVKTAYSLLFFLFPFVVLPFLLGFLFWGKKNQRPEVLALFLFGVASILGAYPMFNFSHVVYSVPLMLIGAEAIWVGLNTRINPFFRRMVPWFLVIWLFPGMILLIGRPVKRALDGSYVFSTFPHFRYALFDQKEYGLLKDHVQKLQEKLPSKNVFLLGVAPGIYYLVCDIQNPTPMDYPLGLDFALREMDTIKKQIQNGEIHTVVLLYPLDYWNAPIDLIQLVQASMHKIKQLDFCEIYE